MKPEIIGRQAPRTVTPGGFTNTSRNNSRRFHQHTKQVSEAATRVLEKRGLLNEPTPWENPALRKGRS